MDFEGMLVGVDEIEMRYNRNTHHHEPVQRITIITDTLTVLDVVLVGDGTITFINGTIPFIEEKKQNGKKWFKPAFTTNIGLKNVVGKVYEKKPCYWLFDNGAIHVEISFDNQKPESTDKPLNQSLTDESFMDETPY